MPKAIPATGQGGDHRVTFISQLILLRVRRRPADEVSSFDISVPRLASPLRRSGCTGLVPASLLQAAADAIEDRRLDAEGERTARGGLGEVRHSCRELCFGERRQQHRVARRGPQRALEPPPPRRRCLLAKRKRGDARVGGRLAAVVAREGGEPFERIAWPRRGRPSRSAAVASASQASGSTGTRLAASRSTGRAPAASPFRRRARPCRSRSAGVGRPCARTVLVAPRALSSAAGSSCVSAMRSHSVAKRRVDRRSSGRRSAARPSTSTAIFVRPSRRAPAPARCTARCDRARGPRAPRVARYGRPGGSGRRREPPAPREPASGPGRAGRRAAATTVLPRCCCWAARQTPSR